MLYNLTKQENQLDDEGFKEFMNNLNESTPAKCKIKLEKESENITIKKNGKQVEYRID